MHHHTVPLAKLIPLAHDPLVVAACRHLADDFKRIGYSEIRLHDSAYHVAFADDLCTVERRVGTGTLQALVEGWVLADVGAWLMGEITEVRLATEGSVRAAVVVQIAESMETRSPA